MPTQQEARSEISLQTLKFLFQILVGLSLTQGARFFFAAGGNQLQVNRPVANAGFGLVLFIAFAFTLIKMAHGYSVYLLDHYGASALDPDGTPAPWFKGKGARPGFDFVVLFIQSAVFFLLSLTLTLDPNGALGFFVVVLVLFAIDVLWSVGYIVLDPKQRTVGTLEHEARNFRGHIAYNSVMVVVTALVLILTRFVGFFTYTQGAWLLVVVLIARSAYDIVWDYDRLFPGAFQKA